MALSITTPHAHTSIAESVFNELISGKDSYYYFYGRNLPFDTSIPEDVQSSTLYENEVRKNISLMKKINVSDVSHAIKRNTWASGTTYDMYDDSYVGGKVTNINIINSGSNYSGTPVIVIQNPVLGGITAQASATVVSGQIIGVSITEFGSNYAEPPIVSIFDETGTGAILQSEISTPLLSYSGKPSLDSSNFYVVTDEFKVYVCLYNNKDSVSTIKPSETFAEPFVTSDGYMWKFMYYIPESLQRKWVIPTHIPVTTELTNSFYTNGGIDYVTILNGGTGYTYDSNTKLYVIGSGIGATLNPIINNSGEIISVEVTNNGSNYSDNVTVYVKSITRTSNTVTVVTNTAHNLVAGIPITVFDSASFSGTYLVSNVIDKNTFTYTHTASNDLLDFGYVGFTNTSKTVNTITRNSNIVTVVTTTAHNLQQKNPVTISGTTNFNGTFEVAQIVNSTTFTFAMNGIDDVSESTGSIIFNTLGIQQISLSSNIVTVTFTNWHNFSVGSTIDVLTTDTTFNGTGLTVTEVVNWYTIKYAKTGTNKTTTSVSIQYPTSIQIIGNGDGKYDNTSAILSPRVFTNGGNGYVTPPTITITPTNGGSGATATASLSDGKISNITVTNGGSGYIGEPTISFSSGTAIARATVHNGSVSRIDIDTVIDDVSIIDPGIGYSNNLNNLNTTVTITGDGTGASLVPVISGGEIVQIIIDNPGYGYTFGNVEITSTSGSGAIMVASTSKGNPDSLQYLTELQAVHGAIYVIKVDNGGNGYTSALLTINGDGFEATAVANIVDGSIDSVTMVTYGYGYNFASVTINGDGSGAILRPIISPKGGHGSNAIKELYANNLLFFSTLSNNDKIDNKIIENSYRQYGIIKNPKIYNTTTKYSQLLGTTCYRIYGTFNPNDFIKNDNIVVNSVQIYNIVDIYDTHLLVNNVTGELINVGDEVYLQSNNSIHYTVTNVVNPDIDKFSGDLISINNTMAIAITQSVSQIIKSRSLIQF